MKMISINPKVFGDAVFTFKRRRIRIWRAFEVIHATKGGGPVLRGEASWKTVCGFVVQGRVIFVNEVMDRHPSRDLRVISALCSAVQDIRLSERFDSAPVKAG